MSIGRLVGNQEMGSYAREEEGSDCLYYPAYINLLRVWGEAIEVAAGHHLVLWRTHRICYIERLHAVYHVE